MKNYQSDLPHFNLKNKRVFIRADLNVPLAGGTIIDDQRLIAILPTIDYVQNHGAKVILATHIGRPHEASPQLSTRNLVNWFENQGYDITFESDLKNAIEESKKNFQSILLLENLRFYSGEEKNDPQFAHELAKLSDYYVNDAFGTLHRNQASITILPQEFAQDHRTIGFLVEKELNTLEDFFNHPKHPFVLVMGGKKVEDKLPLLQHMLGKVDTILLCPAISNSFALSLGSPVGLSLANAELIPFCRKFLSKSLAKNTNIELPVDYLVSTEGGFTGTNYEIRDTDQVKQNECIITIGPKTQERYATIIKKAKTVLYNGLTGDAKRPQTLEGMNKIFGAMSEVKKSIIAGGDTLAAAAQLGYLQKMGYVSTGGGATLALLSGQPLPGLDVLI